jgi:hypothetical protein
VLSTVVLAVCVTRVAGLRVVCAAVTVTFLWRTRRMFRFAWCPVFARCRVCLSFCCVSFDGGNSPLKVPVGWK